MKEICRHCGKSVEPGSGLFVNRVPSLDDEKTHIEMGASHSKGGFTCRVCNAIVEHMTKYLSYRNERTNYRVE